MLNKKNRIQLCDYAYEKDVENRLLLASLTPYEVLVLEEILNGPIRLTISSLMEEVSGEAEELLLALEKLKVSGLFRIDQGVLTIDKEIRKYFDFQFQKFEEDFVPGIEFILGILSRIPLQPLHNWYTLSRTTDSVIDALMEKYFATPLVFKQYLLEIGFESAIFGEIIDHLLSLPLHPLCVSTLRQKYGISLQQFEELALHLEFNFICCKVFIRQDESLKEVFVPFQWWQEHSRINRDLNPTFLPASDVDQDSVSNEFAFIEQLTSMMQQNSFPSAQHKQCLINCNLMHENADQQMQITPLGEEWLSQPLTEKALFFHRNPAMSRVWNPASLRRIERSLQALSKAEKGQWITFKELLYSYNLISGAAERTYIKKENRKWIYSLSPQPFDDPKLVLDCIKNKFYPSGIINLGMTKDKEECLQLTPFGRRVLNS